MFFTRMYFDPVVTSLGENVFGYYRNIRLLLVWAFVKNSLLLLLVLFYL